MTSIKCAKQKLLPQMLHSSRATLVHLMCWHIAVLALSERLSASTSIRRALTSVRPSSTLAHPQRQPAGQAKPRAPTPLGEVAPHEGRYERQVAGCVAGP